MIELNLQKKEEEEEVHRNTNTNFLSDVKHEFRYAEIIQDIRKAFFSGLSRCKNRDNSPHMT